VAHKPIGFFFICAAVGVNFVVAAIAKRNRILSIFINHQLVAATGARAPHNWSSAGMLFRSFSWWHVQT
jgi:hypothetical protein